MKLKMIRMLNPITISPEPIKRPKIKSFLYPLNSIPIDENGSLLIYF